MSSRPNILFFFPDQWRWDWLGLLGKVPVQTPNLDRLAANGTLFEQARVNCPLCAPSRAGLATGRRFHRAGVRDNLDELDPGLPNFFRNFRSAGYEVITTGKSDLHTASECFDPSGWHPHLDKLGFTKACDYAGKWRGVNLLKAGKPAAWCTHLRESGLADAYIEDMTQRHEQRRNNETGRLSTRPSPLPTDACIDDFCGSRSEALLRSVPSGKPWLMWMSFPGPHEPFDSAKEFTDLYDGIEFPPPIDPNTGDGEDHAGIRRNYAAMISHIDHWVGRLIQAVDERGERDNTLIIFASDHGEMLGDHGKWYKQSPYEASVHVPLIVSGPGIPAGVKSESLVELIDIGPTLLDYAGVDPIPEADGKSFSPTLHNASTAHREHTVSALAKWRMIFDGRYKLSQWKDGQLKLWDRETDPHETNDLSNNSYYTVIIDNLMEKLAAESPWFPDDHGYRPF